MSQDEDADAEHTFPAGKYFIGDPCYALSEDTYGHWGTLGYATGKIVTPFGIFIVARTAYGDGQYYDGDGAKYPVDSGTLALIPWNMCEKLDEGRAKRCGRIVTFRQEGRFSCPTDGKIEIYADFNVTIDTACDSCSDSCSEDDQDDDGSDTCSSIASSD
jgi:hypothetical protein